MPTIEKTSLSLLLLFIFLLSFIAKGQAKTEIVPEQILSLDLVFSADLGSGKKVYYSAYTNRSWSNPVQLSLKKLPAFHPTIATTDDGSKWAVWSQMQEKSVQLTFRRKDDSGWTKPEIIATGIMDNRNPKVIIAHDGRPYLAWCGTVSKYPDIFFSRWNGKKWEDPQKVNSHDKVPDLKPQFIQPDSRDIFLAWKTFQEGSYQYVFTPVPSEGNLFKKQQLLKNTSLLSPPANLSIPLLPSFLKSVSIFEGSLSITTNVTSYSRPVHRP